MEAFLTEPKLAKLASSSRMFVTRNLLCFGALRRDNMLMGAFR